jgi:hypothetical protein
MDIKTLEFTASGNNHAEYFLVPKAMKDTFIEFLKGKKVFVQPPVDCMTVNYEKNYFELVVTEGIPPQDGFELVSTFQKQFPELF